MERASEHIQGAQGAYDVKVQIILIESRHLFVDIES